MRLPLFFLMLVFTRSFPLRAFASRVPSSSGSSSCLSSTAAPTNPLLQQDSLPKFASIEPHHLTPAIDTLLSTLTTSFAAFEAAIPASPTYDDLLPALERLRAPPSYAWGVAGHLNGVANGDALRAAYEKSQPTVIETFTKLSQSRKLFDAMVDVFENEKGLSNAQMRALEGSIKAMKLGGVGLDGAEKARFNEIKQRLAELSTTFSNNVLDVTKEYSLIIADKTVVEGVPKSAREMWAASGDGDADEGPWKITLDGPSYVSAMQHIPDRATRETLYRKYVTRASECCDSRNNVPLIEEILTLKLEMAKLLNFNNYAEQSLSSKMAKDVAAVDALSQMIAEKALPAARKELAEITEFSNLTTLEPWDTTFWSERLKESKFELKEEELRPYFKLDSVLDGMFELMERLFGVTVERANGEAEVWNEDVSFYKVFDNDSKKHIASFFLDPYSRPSNKRGGAWMDVCVGKSAATEDDIPVAYLTCNGSPPVGDTPSLMTFREVETLFHETGHGLQHMLTNVDVGDVAGINGVEWDAVELPSQWMENWCYHKPTVKSFAKHYQTGESLPDELFEKLNKQRTFGTGMITMRQLYFGQLDMELHARYTPGGEENIFSIQKKVAAEYMPHLPPIEGDRFLCAFNHIFGGGYAAGYYSYKWAEVLSADAFGAFEDAGLDNDAEVTRLGRLFRSTVLGEGGAAPPSEVFRAFRGRDPSPDALLRHNGLL